MQTIENESKKKKEEPVKTKDVAIRSLDSGKQLEAPATPSPSIQLSKDLAGSLMGLIRDVNKEGVTPETVNASCNAAAQIYKILRLNFEMKKEGF